MLGSVNVREAGFQSTLPVWGATYPYPKPKPSQLNFNPRSPCGERRKPVADALREKYISIHAPRVGSDETLPAVLTTLVNFNPRSPCGERLLMYSLYYILATFQSTLPVWGATTMWLTSPQGIVFQSTLPVWGATSERVSSAALASISIHAPRVGSDIILIARLRDSGNFNPRSPCGERLCQIRRGRHKNRISIHAPRVGSDGHSCTGFGY